MSIKKIREIKNVLGDEIGFVEEWDFSRANLSKENRIQAITQVASICYQNPKALGSEVLYNRLAKESIGLPSSSFEFVPVLISVDSKYYEDLVIMGSAIAKYGEYVEEGHYFLTNYRAVVYDVEDRDDEWVDLLGYDPREIFNTEEECEIIRKHFKVFLFKADVVTRTQMIRHRVNWQELSRRYVSGKRVEFEFYISEKMKDITTPLGFKTTVTTDLEVVDVTMSLDLTTNSLIDLCVQHYNNALDAGIKPEEARRIIPQAMYTQFWGAFTPNYLENFFKLRLDSHAQPEIRKVAMGMKASLESDYDGATLYMSPIRFMSEIKTVDTTRPTNTDHVATYDTHNLK